MDIRHPSPTMAATTRIADLGIDRIVSVAGEPDYSVNANTDLSAIPV